MAISFSQTDVFARDPQPPPLFALPLFNLGKLVLAESVSCESKNLFGGSVDDGQEK